MSTGVMAPDIRDELFKLVRLMNEGMDSKQKDEYEASLMTVLSMLMMVYSSRFLGNEQAASKHYVSTFNQIAKEHIGHVMRECALDVVTEGVETALPQAIKEVLQGDWETTAGKLTLKDLVRSRVEDQVGKHLMSQYTCNIDVSVALVAK